MSRIVKLEVYRRRKHGVDLQRLSTKGPINIVGSRPSYYKS